MKVTFILIKMFFVIIKKQDLQAFLVSQIFYFIMYVLMWLWIYKNYIIANLSKIL